MNNTAVEVHTTVNLPIELIWKLWTTPKDIMQWNNLSADWHTTKAINNLRKGGSFLFVMGLKNGNFSFNFEGTYDEVITNRLIAYTLTDNRKTTVTFTANNGAVKITECFEPNSTDAVELQISFCQAVLHSFKAYAASAAEFNIEGNS